MEIGRKRARGWLKWLAVLLGLGVVLLWDWAGEPKRPSTFLPMTSPILANDVVQGRLNAVPPAPTGDARLTYRFVAQHNGLREIELLLARNGEPDSEENGRFTLTLTDLQGSQLASQTVPTRQIKHNQPFVLRIPVQPDSAGRPYLLTLSGNEANRVTVWGYTVDLLEETTFSVETGPLRNESPETAVQELHFTSRYQLTWPDALRGLGKLLLANGGLLLLTLLFLLLPGALLLSLRPFHHLLPDPVAKIGVMLALGTAVWPLLWYLFSLLGGYFSSWLLWVLMIGGWLLVIFLHSPRTLSPLHLITAPPTQRWHKEHTLLMLVLLVGLAVRLLAVRDIVFPPWVDSVRHGLITAVMSQTGQTITQTGYAPFLPIDRFPYHFGFHTISSSLVLLAGWEIPRLLLGLGQLLNALLPLTVYAGGWLLTRQRRTGLLAAFLVAVPLFFPAYYATWGRYTQLTAMLLMPVLLGFTWRLVRGAKGWRKTWWLLALLVVGLFLVHFRVFVFYVPFAGLVWLLSWGRNGRFMAKSVGLSLLLLLPQLVYLLQNTEPAQAVGRSPGYTAFPTAYYTAGWDRLFLWLAGGLLLPLLVIWLWRRRGWTAVPLLLALWAGGVLLALSGDYLGFPSINLVNLNSYYIITFLPLALFLGSVGAQFWRWLQGQVRFLLAAGLWLSAVGFTAVTLFGLQQQITILNEQTILAQPADAEALSWLANNVPQDAVVAVNSWLWLGTVWSGSDGGTWIVPLTGRQSSTPPADYVYNRDLVDFVRPFNEALTAVADWSAPEATAWLHEQGITHIFIGVRGGQMDPAHLLKNPEVELIYGRNGTFIFELK